MALPLEGCVIPLSGKSEETHGKPIPQNCVLLIALSCLNGFCVLLSSIDNSRTANIAALIKSNGGKYSAKIDDEVTHLVASVTDVEKETAKGESSLFHLPTRSCASTLLPMAFEPRIMPFTVIYHPPSSTDQ
jgi:hypothetical protein